MIYANDNGEDDNKIILHTEDTKVIHGEERVNQIFNNVYQNCNTNFHVSYDKNAPQVIMEASEYSNAYLTLKNKNVKIKSVIDITADNLKYCKQLAELFGAEIRHLEGNKGNFAVADGKEYVATSLALKNTLVSEIIYSNANNVVEQNQFIFDTLWNKAIPVEQRIREIEEGLLPIETKILDTSEEITLHVLELLEKTKVGVSACAPTTAFEVMDNYKPILDAYKALVKKHREGKIQRGVHFLTYIENNNNQVALVKRFLKIGFNIRHLNNSPPFSFIVSEKQLESTIEKMIGGQIATSLLYSTEPLYLQHYQSLFRELWDSAIEAEERMRQIDQG